ncbi:MAG: TolC family protein [Myxococcales bacterium]|nr:TolC family protein [Myxococcales bacterium]
MAMRFSFLHRLQRLRCVRLFVWALGSAIVPSSLTHAAPCSGSIAATTVAPCAVQNSPELWAARLQLQALAAQRRSARRILPSHPQLSVSLAERRPFASSAAMPDQTSVLNWYLTLSQEIEIAGQRGLRVAAIDGEVAAQLRRVAVIEQETAAAALRAFAEVLAAREERTLTERAAEVAATLSRYTAARAAQELVPSIEADLARAEAARWHLLRSEVEQRTRNAEVLLRLSLLPLSESAAALDPLALTGRLEDILPSDNPSLSDPARALPIDDVEARLKQALRLRAELDVARYEVQSKQAQMDLLRRSRIPNLALSFTAQSDGFGERVLGGGLSLPLPLPEPIGPSKSGEVAAAAIAVEQAKTDSERRRRQIALEVHVALSAVQAAQRALSQVPSDLLARAQTDLWAIAEAIRGGRVSLREALLWQRGLLDLLQLHLRARRDYALARIELLRASGLPLLQDSLPKGPAHTQEEPR